jgi:putative transposase
MKRILLPPSMLVSDDRGGGGRSDKDGYVLAAHPGQSQGRPKTTSSSQLIVSSGLPCHAPPKSPETRKTQPRPRSGRRSRDDISYPDNALVESFVDSFKTELIRDRVWKTRSQLELAIVEYVAWFNNERLHTALGGVPPAGCEAVHPRR